jgi:Protein of unknown function (DUF2811)
MKSPVSILTEIPAELHESLQKYLEKNSNWDQDTVFTAALSYFLLQESQKRAENNLPCAQVYLETMFQQS